MFVETKAERTDTGCGLTLNRKCGEDDWPDTGSLMNAVALDLCLRAECCVTL